MDHSAFTYTRTAADAADDYHTRASFLDLPLEVLEYILPYLPPQTTLSLALVSKSFHRLLFPPVTTSTSFDRKHTLRPWRHLNLGESYTAPLPAKKAPQTSSLLPPSPPPSPPPTSTPAFVHDPEAILFKPYILENVRTLILDGLPSVNVSFLEAFFRAGDHPGSVNPLHRAQLLSIRGCPKLEDMGLAMTVLRAQDFPKSLNGIYYFSDPEMDFISPSEGGADVFVSAKMGRALNSAKRRSSNPAGGGWWVETMKMLRGKIAFDAEVCRGKAHFQYDHETAEWQEREPRVASMRLTKGCVGCGAWPESEDHVQQRGSGYGDGDSEVVFPPAPVHSSSLASGKSDRHLRMGGGKVTLRCTDCLDKRYCRGCGKWWCTPCAEQPVQPQSNEQPLPTMGALSRRQVVSRDCYECGYLCGECTSVSTRECVNCRGCYCVLHNEGSDPQHCEWCIESTSHRRGSVSAVARVSPGRRSSMSITSTTATTATTGTPPPNEVDIALSSIAALTDPSAPSRMTTFNPFSTTSPPTSPHLTAIPQPVILLSSRLPPPLHSSSSSAASPSKLKGKGFGTTDSVTGPPASPILKAMSGKGEVHRAAGMRLRRIIGGVGTGVGTGVLGVNATGSGAGAGVGAHAGPAERAEVHRRMRWLGRE